MRDELPPLLNARPRDLGPRPVGTPYVIGGIMMLVSGVINVVQAYLAPKVNPVPQGMGYAPGFSLVGMFFYFGAADGETNPVKYSFATGIGGNGVIPGRKSDNFGVGWAHTQFSDNFVPLLRQRFHLGLEHENAFEMFYNADFPWTLTDAVFLSPTAPTDFETVITHEAGHAVGLGHFGGPNVNQPFTLKPNGRVFSPEAVMNPFYVGGEKRTLLKTDVAALRALYASKALP